MVNRTNIFKQTFLVFFITFFIKILGFIKQAILASVYGANMATDAFYISSSIINALCTIIFSAISITLLSKYTYKLVNESRKKANDLLNDSLKVFIPFSILLTILFYIFAPTAAHFFAPSYSGEQLLLLIKNIKILSVLFIFWCFFLILNVVAESNKSFLPGKCYQLFQNILIVIVAVIFPKEIGIQWLIYVFVLAGLLQCLFMLFSVRKSYKPNIFSNKFNKVEMKNLFILILPLLTGNAIYELNDIVDKRIASGLGGGTVSILTYGASINEIITTLIISSITTVMFSHFSTWVAEKNYHEIETNLKSTMEYIGVIIIPISCFCLISGKQIVSILFGRGSFGEAEVRLTYLVVIGYAIGFLFQAIRANLVKVYYAFGDTRLPMINGIVSVSFNICCSVFLSKFLGALGISLATSFSVLLSSILLSVNIKKYLINFSFIKYKKEFIISFLSTLLSGFVLFYFKKIIVNNLIGFILEVCIYFGMYIFCMIFMNSNSINICVLKKLISKIQSKKEKI